MDPDAPPVSAVVRSPAYNWSNCREYAGEWMRNLREGIGYMICRDGTVLAGLWKDDHLVGDLEQEKIDHVRPELKMPEPNVLKLRSATFLKVGCFTAW